MDPEEGDALSWMETPPHTSAGIWGQSLGWPRWGRAQATRRDGQRSPRAAQPAAGRGKGGDGCPPLPRAAQGGGRSLTGLPGAGEGGGGAGGRSPPDQELPRILSM